MNRGKVIFFACAGITLGVLGGAWVLMSIQEAEAGSADNVSGWAWSDNIGWMSFNSIDCDADEDGLSDGGPPASSCLGYDGENFSVSGQTDDALSLSFRPDGTKMYILGGSDGTVYQYSLSSAWSINTASYDGVSFNVQSEDDDAIGSPFPRKIFFKPDGTKMYMYGNNDDKVNQYSLSTAWDLTTASYDNVSFELPDFTNARGLFFKPDGTKMYVLFEEAEGEVHQYSLATAWEVGTASYDNVSFNVWGQDVIPEGVSFKPDGTKMYVVGGGEEKIFQYSLSTAWDVGTASYDGVSLDVEAQETWPREVFFKPGGTKMYVVGTGSDAVHPYSVRPWNVDISIADYGVQVDSSNNGDLSGYAWADGVGWISFNKLDTGEPPEPPFNSGEPQIARLNSSDELEGWARAISVCPSLPCDTADSEGGWDGWIKFGPGWTDHVYLNRTPTPDEFEGWAWGAEVVGWVAFNKNLGGGDAHTGADHEVLFSGNSAPDAQASCSETPCEVWLQAGQYNPPLLTLINESTDPDGDSDFVRSTWSVISPAPDVWADCTFKCDHAVQLHPPDSYTVELEVEDTAGNTDTVVLPDPVVIKQDIEADFECSINGSEWESCETISVIAGVSVYFRAIDGTNLSIPSEDAGAIDSWAWDFEFDTPPGGSASPSSLSCTGPAPNDCSNTFDSGNPVTFDTTGQYTVQLCLEDDAGRTHCTEQDINADLPFPDWHEISPF